MTIKSQYLDISNENILNIYRKKWCLHSSSFFLEPSQYSTKYGGNIVMLTLPEINIGV